MEAKNMVMLDPEWAVYRAGVFLGYVHRANYNAAVRAAEQIYGDSVSVNPTW